MKKSAAELAAVVVVILWAPELQGLRLRKTAGASPEITGMADWPGETSGSPEA